MDERFYEMCNRAEQFDLTRVAEHFAAENDEDLETVLSWVPELKKWLVMAAYQPDNNYVIFGVVDQLWHTFILFSREYAEFCDSVAGEFIHHVPAAKIFEVEREKGFLPETTILETARTVKEVRVEQVDKYRDTLTAYMAAFDPNNASDIGLTPARSWFAELTDKDHPNYDPAKDPLRIWARINEVGAVTCPTTSCCGGGGGCGCIHTGGD